jgi:hypothetical protein
MVDLLDVSALPGSTAHMRPLEATIVVRGDVVPWCHGVIRPAARCSWMSGSAAIYARASLSRHPSVAISRSC